MQPSGATTPPATPSTPAPSGWPATLAWLSHPVTVVALAVMALNDHVLKASFGSWWTGKLSDAVGLVFFPAVVGLVVTLVAPRLGARPRIAVSIAVTAAGFAWVKATAVGAATASSVLSLTLPSTVRADATDLLVLPFLAVAWWTGLRAAGVRTRARQAAGWAMLVPAVLVSAATSYDWYEGAETILTDGERYYVRLHLPGQWEHNYRVINPGGTWTIPFEVPDEPQSTTIQPCVPSLPDVCFRPMADGVGIEVTPDGGQTWQVETHLSEQELAYLSDNRPDNAPGWLRVRGLAVIGDAPGYIVVAAVGYDGMWVRDTEGTWKRVGFTPMQGLEDMEPVAIPDMSTVIERTPVPLSVIYAAGIMTVALPVLVGVMYPRRPVRAWRICLTGLMAGIAATLLIAAGSGATMLATYGPEDTNEAWYAAFAVALLGALGLTVGSAAIVARRALLATCLAAAIYGAAYVVGTVANLAWSSADQPATVVCIAVGVVVGGLGASGVLVRAPGEGLAPDPRGSQPRLSTAPSSATDVPPPPPPPPGT